MDLLNFSFWSEKSEEDRFQVEYRDKRWTGYWSLVAGLQRGLEEGLWSSLILASDLALFTDIMMSELYHSYVTKNTKSCPGVGKSRGPSIEQATSNNLIASGHNNAIEFVTGLVIKENT